MAVGCKDRKEKVSWGVSFLKHRMELKTAYQ